MIGKVYAGIVLYNPCNDMYLRAIQVLKNNDIITIIFDNSPNEMIRNNHNELVKEYINVKYISSDKGNIGLSAAYNCIIESVLSADNVDGFFIFDQDTEINMIAINKILLSYKSLSNNNVGSISGYAVRENGIPYRIRLDKTFDNKNSTLKRVTRVPSSFTFYPISTIRKIGLFQTDFFIDHLDIDYSLRCQQNNLNVYVDIEAKYVHCVGNGDIYLFKKPLFPISDPYRHYYQIRNLILSYVRNEEKVTIIIKEIISKILVVFLISVYAGGFFERFKYLFWGIVDGFKNKGGELKKK